MVPVILVVAGAMLFGSYSEVRAWRTRKIIREFLDAPNDQFFVSVNYGAWLSDNAKVQAIRGIHSQEAHHTHTVHNVAVSLRRKESAIELTLKRDSANPQEYWVFWTKDDGTPGRLEIGRIQTSAFNGD